MTNDDSERHATCSHCNGDPSHNDPRDCDIDALRADNARLTAELALERETVEVRGAIVSVLTQERDAARAELAEAREDAARYRWLRSRHTTAGLLDHVIDDCHPPYVTLKFEAELDAAIDAARGGE